MKVKFASAHFQFQNLTQSSIVSKAFVLSEQIARVTHRAMCEALAIYRLDFRER